MSQTPRRPLRSSAPRTRRPVQDIATTQQQASQFPSVGMTLRSYKYDPRDHRRVSGGVVVKKGRFGRLKEKLTLKRSAILLTMIVLIIGGWLGGKFLYNAHKIFGGNILGVLNATKLKGEDQGRVNILLAGNSADDAGHSGGSLTDSVMIVSIDTKTKQAFMLSIPRDLWVEVPNEGGHAKINSVYVRGEEEGFSENGYAPGGMGMLEKVVADNFGMPIHYYSLVNYTAFKQAVDAVGGIDVTIKSNDPRGLYDPNLDYSTRPPQILVKLSNGTHHLNGQQSLNLARARGDSYNSYGFAESDFARTQHQRQMLVALKNKAVSAQVLANPAKLSSLSDAIGSNVKTDFNASEVRRLYDIMKGINSSNIKSLSLNKADGKSLLASYASPRGESALIPSAGVDDFSEIQAFLKKQLSSDPIVREGATVVVLNATDTSGVASKVRTRLNDKNLTVGDIADARANQAKTSIIDNSGGKMPKTLALLKQLYGNQVTSTNPYADVYEADFILLVGADQVGSQSSSQ